MQMFIVIGMPRTGSTLVQTTLEQHPNIKMHGELFHPNDDERMGAHVINDNNNSIFFDSTKDDAIDFLRANVWTEENSKKYDAVGFKLFGERVQCLGTEKLFLRLKETFPSLKFIHIERDDLLECWVSRETAKKTGQWFSSSQDKKTELVNDLQVVANPLALQQFFQSYEEVNNFFKSDFFPKPNYLHIDYDQIATDFKKTSRSIFTFLGLKNVSVKQNIKKQRTLTATDQIQNIEEIRQFFAESKYAALVGTPSIVTTKYKGLHAEAQKLPIEEWIRLVGKSTEQKMSLGEVLMPSAPPPQKQAIFHGNSGQAAINSAAPVYRYVLQSCQQQGIDSIKTLLDFGCGWGRFTRLFVRDVEEAGLIGIDPWGEALQMCREHMPYAAFVRSQFNPPLAFRDELFDVVFANSIFSHLSEVNALAWIKEISRILRPGGLLVATTHSKHWLAKVKEFQSGEKPCESDWHRGFRDSEFDFAMAVNSHKNGEFIFASTGNGQNNPDYGDTFIPEKYIQKVWGEFLELVEFIDDPARFPQATFTLRKKLSKTK